MTSLSGGPSALTLLGESRRRGAPVGPRGKAPTGNVTRLEDHCLAVRLLHLDHPALCDLLVAAHYLLSRSRPAPSDLVKCAFEDRTFWLLSHIASASSNLRPEHTCPSFWRNVGVGLSPVVTRLHPPPGVLPPFDFLVRAIEARQLG